MPLSWSWLLLHIHHLSVASFIMTKSRRVSPRHIATEPLWYQITHQLQTTDLSTVAFQPNCYVCAEHGDRMLINRVRSFEPFHHGMGSVNVTIFRGMISTEICLPSGVEAYVSSYIHYQTVMWLPIHDTTCNCYILTHWGRVTHICVSKVTIIVSEACRLVGAKPLSEPRLKYCQLDHWEPTSVKF